MHTLGWVMPTTFSDAHVTFGFYGLTYSMRHRGPYERRVSPWLGNEFGLETRVITSYRTGSGITTTFSLSPLASARRRSSPLTHPSLVGLLLPEVGFVLVNPKETGGRYTTELFVRHLARFQWVFGGGGPLALELAPFVQLAVPHGDRPLRIEGGLLVGVSSWIPPK